MREICCEKFCRLGRGSIGFADSSSLFGAPSFRMFMEGIVDRREYYFWVGERKEYIYAEERYWYFSRDTSDDIFSWH